MRTFRRFVIGKLIGKPAEAGAAFGGSGRLAESRRSRCGLEEAIIGEGVVPAEQVRAALASLNEFAAEPGSVCDLRAYSGSGRGLVIVPDLIRHRPAHRRTRRPGLLAALPRGLPARPRTAACGAAAGPAGHHQRAAARSCSCSATSSAPAARPWPAAPRSPRPAPHARRTPARQAAGRSQATIISAGPK